MFTYKDKTKKNFKIFLQNYKKMKPLIFIIKINVLTFPMSVFFFYESGKQEE